MLVVIAMSDARSGSGLKPLDGSLETELCRALVAGGYEVVDVRTGWVLPDGSRERDGVGVIASLQEIDIAVEDGTSDGTAHAIVGFSAAWLRARRRHEADDVEYVCVRAADGRRLHQARVPRD